MSPDFRVISKINLLRLPVWLLTILFTELQKNISLMCISLFEDVSKASNYNAYNSGGRICLLKIRLNFFWYILLLALDLF